MSTTTQTPQAGSTKQSVEPPARFDWMQVVRHTLFACLCGVVCGFASIVLCLFVGAARSLFERAPWLIWLLPVMAGASLAWHDRKVLPSYLRGLRDGRREARSAAFRALPPYIFP